MAFSDRDRYLTDPEFSPIPVDELLSIERGRELAQKIQFDSALNFRETVRSERRYRMVWRGG